ncbi:hypothetical protein SPRG_01728 [Saprolegnia parasitica CBS 223.65]|uniref:Tyrosinase copper-binding domain-containing protein n=1 Tax=Saprolegnia parasitica (strain CBS 223.65) TaxID=695850 RepID=A0A067CT24_SAPPC|nr:hypothetical protein SPRG_01728 [Saprolegnia parasitica CBS 223.65]KDO33849.1 hypothetical protein SPRG_01728 [Saprolegnia parasitica CBS 223.65]|eukprot:XP_012195485.1 hypothetical protein SPRG_01728 [Saprolegnia parasitica CBS 223.65]
MRSHFYSLFSALAALVAAQTIVFPTSAPVSCPVPAIRQSWLNMTATDQQTYLDAVGIAMDKGYHFNFLQILSEPSTYFEYYSTCGWAYSSRRLLLAYQNMLRSLGPAYACITIPYWDYFADNAQIQTGTCDGTLGNCSSILTGMGGNAGAPTSLTIDGISVSGAATTSYPLNRFCELYNISCSGYVPRGPDWNTTIFPSGFGYATMANMLKRATSFYSFTFGLKNGIHNSLHLALGGAMVDAGRTMADPLFFSQHAALDMMVQVYIECYFGTNRTVAKKLSSPWAFSICAPSIAEMPKAPRVTSNITQRLPQSFENYTTIVDAANHPVIGQFFASTPPAYFSYVDTTDMGALSYNYDKNVLVSSLLANGFICPVKAYNRRLEDDASLSTKQAARVRPRNARDAAVRRLNKLRRQFWPRR